MERPIATGHHDLLMPLSGSARGPAPAHRPHRRCRLQPLRVRAGHADVLPARGVTLAVAADTIGGRGMDGAAALRAELGAVGLLTAQADAKAKAALLAGGVVATARGESGIQIIVQRSVSKNIRVRYVVRTCLS